MSPNPVSFLDHLRSEGYNSRSNKHSNSLAQAIVHDLVKYCPGMQQKAQAGELVYDLNFTLRVGTADWNVDLVLGPPELGATPPEPGEAICRKKPSTVQVAVEIKSVMTEHHKAVKNRKRDLEAHHEHVHNYGAEAIAAGVLIVNAAPIFQSSLRSKPTTHKDPRRLVEHCLAELRAVATRGGSTGQGLDARCAVVVVHDNIDAKKTRFLTGPPAPQVGDPLNYDAFVQAICARYTNRFA